MMNTICFLLFCIVASSIAYEVVIDGEREYLLVPIESSPLSRLKRQTRLDFINTGSWRASLSHRGNIINNDNHHLSGMANVSKGIPKGPWSVGGGLDYIHKPSGSSLSGRAQYTQGVRYQHPQFLDLGVSGRYNFVNKPNTKVFTEGHYERRYGPFGAGKPNYGVEFGVNHKF